MAGTARVTAAGAYIEQAPGAAAYVTALGAYVELAPGTVLPSGPFAGTQGSVVYAVGTATMVGEIREWSLSVEANVTDVSAFGSSWRKFVSGVKAGQGAFSGQFDDGDAPQEALLGALMRGEYVALRLFVAPTLYFNVGSALITDIEPGTDIEGAADVSYAWVANGAVGTAAVS